MTDNKYKLAHVSVNEGKLSNDKLKRLLMTRGGENYGKKKTARDAVNNSDPN